MLSFKDAIPQSHRPRPHKQDDVPPLREQLVAEVSAMAAHALASGQKVPPAALHVIVEFDEKPDDVSVVELASAHEQLTQAIVPMTPATALALTGDLLRGHRHRRSYTYMSRYLMVGAVTSLVVFIILSLSPYINDARAGNIFQSSGVPLFVNELFFLSAAALGASFAGLSQLERSAANGTFDPRQEGSFWKRFLLGIISGLLLATVIDVQDKDGDGGNSFSAAGLALLGGYSCTVVYRILNRLVETLENLVKGGGDEVAVATQQAAQARSSAQLLKDRMRIATKLSQLQRDLGAGADSAAALAQIDELTQELLQNEATRRPRDRATASPLPASAASPASTETQRPEPPAIESAHVQEAEASLTPPSLSPAPRPEDREGG